MVQNAMFRMRNMWDMNTVAVVQESVRKEAAWAAHGG